MNHKLPACFWKSLLRLNLVLALGLVMMILLTSPTSIQASPNSPPTPNAGETCFARLSAGTVYSSSDASAIQQAVNAAGAGETIRVAGSCIGVQMRANHTQTVYISKSLTLQGGYTTTNWTVAYPITQPATLNANRSGWVVYVDITGMVTLDSLRLINGAASYGGGIYNDGKLQVQNSTLANNSTTGSGGGISNWNILTVTNSTISGNTSSAGGGGIFNYKTLWIQNSTLSGNTASYGGGIENSSTGALTMINNTISDNTTTYSGGGIYNDGVMSSTHTIIANSAKINCWSMNTSVNDHNLVEDGSCNAAHSGDPRLNLLADNGGSTWTHALLPDSPAIDALSAGNCPLTTDQRGMLRPQGAGCDIGAYEYSQPPNCFARLASGTVYSSNNAAAVQQAVDAAGAGETIQLAGTCIGVQKRSSYTQTVYISKSLTLQGGYTTTNWTTAYPLTQPTTLHANRSGRVIYVAGGHVTLDALHILSGTATYGGGIYNNDTLLIKNCVLTDNLAAGGEGGAIYNIYSLTLQNCTLSNNAAYYGGGISNRIFARITDSTLSNNTGSYMGGGIYNSSYGQLEILTTTLSNNGAMYGGGTANTGNVTVEATTFYSNSASQYGGGIYNTVSGIFTATNSTFSSNSATLYGGGIENSADATLVLIHSTVSDNSAGQYGGVDSDGVMNYHNTLIANSTGGDCYSGMIGTNSYNLVEDNSCNPTYSGDPLSGPPANHGGNTWTHPLLSNSRAINAIPAFNCPLTTDQRGSPRPQGRGCDIGAYEGTYFIITPTATAGGTLTPTALQTLTIGSHVSFTITPNPGYHLVNVTIDGHSVGAVTLYAFTNITTDHTINAVFAVNTYTITPTAGAGGSITPGTAVTLNYSSSQTFTIAPLPGYHVVDVAVDGRSIGAVSLYAFQQITANHTITASFAINTYILTPTTNAGGTVTPPTPQTVNHGSNATFAITPNPGYHLTNVTIDGISTGAVSRYTFTNVITHHTLNATFAVNTYTITPTAGAGGTLNPATARTVNYGSHLTFTITPAPGHRLVDVVVDGRSVGTVTLYAFTNITADHTITAAFALNTYTITPTAGTGGTITPGTPQAMTISDTLSFSITPNIGYHIVNVAVDGLSVGAVNSYTFRNISADHIITAAFALNTYTITPTAGANGKITPETPQTAHYGDQLTFSITPNTGYYLTDVGVDGISIGIVKDYTFTNISANHTITAAFALSTFTITPIAGPNGTIAPGTAQTLNYGTSMTFTIIPNPGYRIADVVVDGSSVGPVSLYAFTHISASHTIVAAFTPNTLDTYSIIPIAGPNGVITPGIPQTVNHGANSLFTIAANPGYHIVDVGVDGLAIGPVNTYAFTNVSSNHIITATFAPNSATFTLTPIAGPNGTITPATPQTVTAGSDLTFTIAADPGYHIADVVVDGNSVGPVNLYAFTNITTHHTLTAAFALDCQALQTPTFTVAPLQPRVGETVRVTGTVSNGSQPITFTWNWGDSTPDIIGITGTHRFPLTTTLESYTITMGTVNTCSGPISVTQRITVTPYQNFLPVVLRNQ